MSFSGSDEARQDDNPQVVISLKKYQELLDCQNAALRVENELAQSEANAKSCASSRIAGCSHTRELEKKVDLLTQDITALKTAFAGELDQLRNELRTALGSRISHNNLARESTSSPLRQSSQWTWPNDDFADSDCAPTNFLSSDHISSCQISNQLFSPVVRQIIPEKQPPMLTQVSTKTPAVSDEQDSKDAQLVQLAINILTEHGNVPIGALGSLLHKAAKDHTLPSLLKERYGGLKKFLQCHTDCFVLGADHPYNPHVRLKCSVNELDMFCTPSVSALLQSNSTPLLSSSSSISLSAQPPNIPLGEESTGVKACGRKRRKNKREGKSDTFCTSGCLTPVLSFATSVVGVGSDRKEALARCTVVNFKSMIVYDKFITPTEKITDYRTHSKGIKPQDLIHSESVANVRTELTELFKDRTIVGHSLDHDLELLAVVLPRHKIRDTSAFKLLCPDGPRDLKTLVLERLGVHLQTDNYDSVEDARAVLAIYKSVMQEWEQEDHECSLQDHDQHMQDQNKCEWVPSSSYPQRSPPSTCSSSTWSDW